MKIANVLPQASLDGEIKAIRILLRRAIRLSDGSEDLPDTLHILDQYGQAASRIGKLLLQQQKLKEKTKADQYDNWMAQIDQAIAEVNEEWKEARELGS